MKNVWVIIMIYKDNNNPPALKIIFIKKKQLLKEQLIIPLKTFLIYRTTQNDFPKKLNMTIPLILETVFMIFLTTSNKILLFIINFGSELKREIWQGTAMRIPCNDNKRDKNYLKVKWTDNKTEDIVLIKNVSVGYIQRRVTTSTYNYFSGIHIKKLVQDITTQI